MADPNNVQYKFPTTLPFMGPPGSDPQVAELNDPLSPTTVAKEQARKSQGQSTPSFDINTYDGTSQLNKYVDQNTAKLATADSQVIDQTLDAASKAGLPTMTPAQLHDMSAKYGNNPDVQGLSKQLEGMAKDPEHAPDLGGAFMLQAQKVADNLNINVWQLIVIALKGGMADQNETLKYDLSKLEMFSKMSDNMAEYTKILEQTQVKLDQAVANAKDDKKDKVEVDMPNQYSFGPSSMYTLDKDGNMFADNMADGATGKGAGKVNANSLNIKNQIYTQQRQQLQKNVDKWTNQFQSDNEAKNQMTTTVTSVLKNMYDMQSAVTRNING